MWRGKPRTRNNATPWRAARLCPRGTRPESALRLCIRRPFRNPEDIFWIVRLRREDAASLGSNGGEASARPRAGDPRPRATVLRDVPRHLDDHWKLGRGAF